MLTAMGGTGYDATGDARRALEYVHQTGGAPALDDSATLQRLLPDLLPDVPRETNLLHAAASNRVGALLGERLPRMSADAAVRDVAALLVERTALDQAACLWVVAEYARVLGHPVSVPASISGQPGAAPTPTAYQQTPGTSPPGWPTAPASPPPPHQGFSPPPRPAYSPPPMSAPPMSGPPMSPPVAYPVAYPQPMFYMPMAQPAMQVVQPAAPVGPPARTNPLAVASLVLGCLIVPAAFIFVGYLFIPASIVCGHVARRQIRQRREAGNGLALAGIIIGYSILGLIALGLIVEGIAHASH